MPKTRSTSKPQREPVSSSTPRVFPSVSSRPSIHDRNTEMPSPIPVNEPDAEDSDHSTESSEESDSPGEPDVAYVTAARSTSLESTSNTLAASKTVYKYLILLMVVLCAASASYLKSNYYSTETMSLLTLADIQSTFHSQSEQLWHSFNISIAEVKTYNKPSVFLLLYEDQSEETVNRLVGKISQYGVCEIKQNCTLKPLTLTKDILNSERALSDYGNLIHEYGPELDNRGVLIVNNIEQMKGKVAQIFHSMCDEFTPLVAKAIFIFTMKVEKFPTLSKGDMKFVEDVLHKNWSDLDDDLFYPLITRITNIVLRVFPET